MARPGLVVQHTQVMELLSRPHAFPELLSCSRNWSDLGNLFCSKGQQRLQPHYCTHTHALLRWVRNSVAPQPMLNHIPMPAREPLPRNHAPRSMVAQCRPSDEGGVDEKFPPRSPAADSSAPGTSAVSLELRGCVSSVKSWQSARHETLCLLVRTGVGKRQDGMPL